MVDDGEEHKERRRMQRPRGCLVEAKEEPAEDAGGRVDVEPGGGVGASKGAEEWRRRCKRMEGKG
jgi:hypothetical protein